MAEGADLICSQDGCTAKVARDGHLACSTHSPCFVDFRYDPTACPQCECWVQQLRLYPKDTRPAPPPLVSLRAVWQHLKKAAQKRGSPRVEVAVQALALELGLVRARTVSGGTSASPERASSQARQHSTPRRRSRSRIRSISRRSSTSGLTPTPVLALGLPAALALHTSEMRSYAPRLGDAPPRLPGTVTHLVHARLLTRALPRLPETVSPRVQCRSPHS
ncbi:uncharacterized protein LOC143024896 [Oratosquilla oratoria]|uniref:uncharacterized protein LOC143024896 n=1 Tax=Oratosquilla oratoria TaxID=337810 RepID=UPI003F7688E2